MQRNKLPVLARLNRLDPTEYTWFWVEGMVTVGDPLATTQVSETLFTVVNEIQFFTRNERPTIQTWVEHFNSQPMEDYVYWKGDYYATYGTADWMHMGRSGYRHLICMYNSYDDQAALFPQGNEVPDFQEGYDDFINAVGKVSLTINLALCPFANNIMEC